MTVTAEQKEKARRALVVAGFTQGQARELVAGPKDLRDEFAGRAMAAMLVNHKWVPTELAQQSYGAADAMMLERAK